VRVSSATTSDDASGQGGRPRSVGDQPHVDATQRLRASGERALVLGGGGSTGNAWLIGVVAGLFEGGLDVTEADLIVGTSAGSTAAAQITGAPPTELLAATLAAVPHHRSGQVGSNARPVGSDARPVGADARPVGADDRPVESNARPGGLEGGRGPSQTVADHLERMRRIIAAAEDAADMRRSIGAAALGMDASSDGAHQARWRATVAARLPSQDWPERAVLITAVDAHTGEPVVFDRHSGVDLVDAVAASCSGPGAPPYRIGDHRYIDGGYRSNAENADLAAGYGRVLVLSPFGGRSLLPPAWGLHLAAQVDALRAGGSRVETIFPDRDAEHMFGTNAMDLSLRAPAARAGYDQGRALAGRLSEFWR
jgi:NTE family protein